MIAKIVSGGQTGADRGGLEAAIELKIPHGGWCPKGRRAEDGLIPKKYRLRETQTTNYLERTEKNVKEADVTLVLTYGKLTRGSKRTIDFARQHQKTWMHLDLKNGRREKMEMLGSWLLNFSRPLTLNIAGTRESKVPGMERGVKNCLIWLASFLGG